MSSEKAVPGQFQDAEDLKEVPDVQVQVDVSQDKMENLDLVESSEDGLDDFEDDFDDEDWDSDVDEYHGAAGSKAEFHQMRQNSSVANHQRNNNVTKFQPSDKVFKKYASKINVERYEGPRLSGSVINPVLENGKKMDKER